MVRDINSKHSGKTATVQYDLGDNNDEISTKDGDGDGEGAREGDGEGEVKVGMAIEAENHVENKNISLRSQMSSNSAKSNQLQLSQKSFVDDFQKSVGLINIDSLSDDSDESLMDEIEFRRQSRSTISISKDTDFFADLGEMPSLSDISGLEEGEDDLPRIQFETDLDPNADIGVFVDPLTGQLLSDEEKPIVVEEEPSVEMEPEEVDVEDLGTSDSADELFELKVCSDDMLVTFEDRFRSIRIVEEIFDSESYLKELEHKELVDSITKYLKDIINVIVENWEETQSKNLLRNRLDKFKLMDDICAKVIELQYAKEMNAYLDRKCSDYCRRKHLFNSIEPTSLEKMVSPPKYITVLNEFNELLSREDETRRIVGKSIDELNVQLNRSIEHNIHWTNELNNLITKTVCVSNPNSKLNAWVQNVIQHMGQIRNRISETRLLFIQREHTYATLAARLEKLEDLGNGLLMRDFENTTIDVMKLSSKIEERSYDLNRMRARFNKNLHILAHAREKSHMERQMGCIHKTAYQDLLQQRIVVRRHLYYLKLQRDKIRRAITDASYNSGILDKPELMYDYDDTVAALENKKIINQKLRDHLQNLIEIYPIYVRSCGQPKVHSLRKEFIRRDIQND